MAHIDMQEVVSKEMAMVLRDAGYPQTPIVGNFYYHPMGMIVKCTQRKKNAQGADPKVLAAPTIAQAQLFTLGKEAMHGVIISA